MIEIARFEIPGEPRTKKNHSRILKNHKTGARFIAPSEQYKEYENMSGWFVPCERIDYPVNLKVLYYMETQAHADNVDLGNLLAATCDILTKYECIKDDKARYVKGHDGSRVLCDEKKPRAEIIIEKWDEDETWVQAEGFYVCPVCGKAFHDKTNFCPECGERLR